MILVIDRRASLVRHDSGVLRVDTEGEEPRRAPIAQLELVVVYGNPMAETAVWRALANAAVPVVMLPSRGPDGPAVLAGGLATQLPLRRMQHRCANQPDQALALARWVLRHKLAGYDLPLATLRERHGADPTHCETFLRRRDQALAALSQVANHDAAMGVEGQVAHAWFGLLAQSLNPNWKFTGRNRRPPLDPVNALLSLGYTLVGTEIHHGVMAAGLDPSLGFLHQPSPGRESMVLDLIEVFRGGVDHFVLSHIDPGGPDQADYYYREAEGCRLSKAARPVFFGAWAERRDAWPYPLGQQKAPLPSVAMAWGGGGSPPNAVSPKLTPYAPDDVPAWPTGGLREQISGWIERLRTELKCVAPNPEEPAL
jgi:CRISPR-associated protein Cas1